MIQRTVRVGRTSSANRWRDVTLLLLKEQERGGHRTKGMTFSFRVRQFWARVGRISGRVGRISCEKKKKWGVQNRRVGPGSGGFRAKHLQKSLFFHRKCKGCVLQRMTSFALVFTLSYLQDTLTDRYSIRRMKGRATRVGWKSSTDVSLERQQGGCIGGCIRRMLRIVWFLLVVSQMVSRHKLIGLRREEGK